MAKSRDSIPASAVRRLTKYLAAVQALRGQGIEWISSTDLADALGLTSSTVRQDLSHLEFSGVSKKGYETKGLDQVLTSVLGADRSWNVVVVGAGNLGRALALHEEFSRRGFKICGIFDNDPAKEGTRIGALTVGGMRRMPALIRAKNVEIGVIAVPPAAAQSAADLLIVSGIKGLLNLALAHIAVPSRVTVVDARIVASLMELTHAITFNR